MMRLLTAAGTIAQLLLLATELAAPPTAAPTLRRGQMIELLVEHVHDGDTFHVTEPGVVTHRIRIHGADTPEIERKGFWPTQPGAVVARDWLAREIAGKQVVLEVKGRNRDRYVCRVWLGKRDLGLELVERGLAWADPRYATAAQKAAEQKARKAKRGLWADAKSQPPWEWRDAKR